jgi:hypothetical protein
MAPEFFNKDFFSFLAVTFSLILMIAFFRAVTLRFRAFSTICLTISLNSFLSSTTIFFGFDFCLKPSCYYGTIGAALN